jgi:uncharacterized protein (TIGR02302 family)
MIGTDSTGTERAGANKPGADKGGADKTGADKAGTDKAGVTWLRHDMAEPANQLAPLFRLLANRRRLARLALWFEALWPALWPATGLAGVFLCAALLDCFLYMPVWAHLAVLAGFGLGVAWLLATSLRRVTAPDAAAADRRLERASGLRHRPLATLVDRPATTDATALALWQAHVARAATQLQRLRIGRISPGLPARDLRALRGGLIVALAACFAIAGGDSWPRILRSLTPELPVGQPGTASLVQAWITPPAYTAMAPVFLKAEGGAVAVPAGSHLTVSVTGGLGEPSLSYDGHTGRFQTLDAGSFQAERDLPSGGHLVVRRLGRSVGAWDITAIADAPPTASWGEAPGPAPRSVQTRLPWVAADDYGVTSLQAEIRLRDRPEAPPLVVTIPLPGAPKSAHGTALPDLSAHPWAGLPVIARLVARDAPGQTGTSDDAGFVLPERFFHNPIARALMAVRKGLSLHPEARDTARIGLAAIAGAEDPLSLSTFANDAGAYLNLQAIGGLLVENPAAAAVEEAQDRLWQLALHLEEGGAERTARALEAAREAVSQQLEALRREPTPVTPQQKAEHDAKLAELQRRMAALREAIQQHLQALAEQARREGAMAPQDPNTPQVDPRSLDRLAQQMQQDAQQGRLDQAEQEMAQLEQMLQQLQNARPQRPQDAQNAQRQQRGRQQMSAVQDMVQRQTGLLDHAQGRAAPSGQGPAGQAPQDQPDDAAQAPGPDDAQRQQDAKVQHALRRALGELMQQSGDLTGEVPSALSDADTAMRQAGQALAQGQDDAAGAAEQRAIEALQKGGQQLAQSMSRQFGMSMQLNEGDGQDGPGDQPNGQNAENGDGDSGMQAGTDGTGGYRRGGQRDPLGRLTQDGSSGSDESSDVHVPDQMERARTRDIQNELRRRGAERSRPEDELQYIDRLLKPF